MDMKYIIVLVEAIAQNRSSMVLVDRLYEEKKEAIYPLLQANPYVNHSLFDSAGLNFSIACRRVLGLYLHQPDSMLPVIKKGWNAIYRRVQSNQFDMRKFSDTYVINSAVSDNDAMAATVVAAYLLKAKGMDEGTFLLSQLDEYADHQERSFWGKSSKSKARSEAILVAAHELLETLERSTGIKFNSYAQVVQLFNAEYASPDTIRFIESLLWEIENEGIVAINITEPHLSRDDIIVSLGTYLVNHKPEALQEGTRAHISADELIRYLIPATTLKILSRAFRNTKLAYFRNNSESQMALINDLQAQSDASVKAARDAKNETETIQLQLLNAQNQIKDLSRRIDNLEKGKSALEAQLQAEGSELVALRDFVFSLTPDNTDREPATELTFPSDIRVLICGGHETWRRRLGERLPSNFSFLSDSMIFDVSILGNQDWLLINVAGISHAYYERIMANLPSDVNIGYLAGTNIEKTLNTISHLLPKHDSPQLK